MERVQRDENGVLRRSTQSRRKRTARRHGLTTSALMRHRCMRINRRASPRRTHRSNRKLLLLPSPYSN